MFKVFETGVKWTLSNFSNVIFILLSTQKPKLAWNLFIYFILFFLRSWSSSLPAVEWTQKLPYVSQFTYESKQLNTMKGKAIIHELGSPPFIRVIVSYPWLSNNFIFVVGKAKGKDLRLHLFMFFCTKVLKLVILVQEKWLCVAILPIN